MKVENLKKAEELREKLRVINSQIETAEKATHVKLYGGNSFEVSTEKMKYDTTVLLATIKPVFLNALNREKQDILNEIEAID